MLSPIEGTSTEDSFPAAAFAAADDGDEDVNNLKFCARTRKADTADTASFARAPRVALANAIARVVYECEIKHTPRVIVVSLAASHARTSRILTLTRARRAIHAPVDAIVDFRDCVAQFKRSPNCHAIHPRVRAPERARAPRTRRPRAYATAAHAARVMRRRRRQECAHATINPRDEARTETGARVVDATVVVVTARVVERASADVMRRRMMVVFHARGLASRASRASQSAGNEYG
jgi:hypothetical protein